MIVIQYQSDTDTTKDAITGKDIMTGMASDGINFAIKERGSFREIFKSVLMW